MNSRLATPQQRQADPKGQAPQPQAAAPAGKTQAQIDAEQRRQQPLALLD